MVTLTQKKNNKKYCLDVYGGIKTENNPLIMYPCHKGPNQKFLFKKGTKQIISKYSKKCMDVKNGKVVQKKCHSPRKTRKSQKWILKNGEIRQNEKCLDVKAGNYNSGQLITYPCHKGPNQKFRVSKN